MVIMFVFKYHHFISAMIHVCSFNRNIKYYYYILCKWFETIPPSILSEEKWQLQKCWACKKWTHLKWNKCQIILKLVALITKLTNKWEQGYQNYVTLYFLKQYLHHLTCFLCLIPMQCCDPLLWNNYLIAVSIF